jgi:hypothetical protein
MQISSVEFRKIFALLHKEAVKKIRLCRSFFCNRVSHKKNDFVSPQKIVFQAEFRMFLSVSSLQRFLNNF